MSAIIIKNDRVKAVKRKHPWIFSKAIKEVIGDPQLGETVDLLDENNKWLAKAAYSPHSQIRARIWSFEQNQEIDIDFFKAKIERALFIRQPMIKQAQTTGYRLLCAESDGIPGLTVDVYNTTLVCQILSAGVEANKDIIVEALKTVFPDHVIYERSDVDVRQKEGLKNRRGEIFGKLQSPIIIEENGIKAYVDVENGHKTGFYLDQRDNRKTLEKYVEGKTVLNCFSYTGTFGLTALKGGAKHVTQVDMSQSALDIAAKNIDLNNFDQAKVSLVKHDVFKLLRKYREEGTKFDVIIMDPPKFAESKAQLRGACRGYKDINMIAMQLLNPGGIILSFSCSGLMEPSLFQKILADAALDAKRDMVFIEKLSQAQDHIISSVYPEGYYLKGFVAQVF
ncbi:class I SAM-dependent methyltransferase [Psychrosphaera sp. B3R10]|uniref:class I SAM-dependent rRNA methyltransferase n=1 Tax=unclassified Psychrosphaera TaxID=2641570 RepID=UPI001C085099|nr:MULTISPECIES: class I SAM-dependent methyltransferase [unclassified Psychrosphaera]MBU2882231.1 class I SAM-dependent methyltransferase [Psychrosphaera sp. I2R16]MBU2988912.1 class I SAM-dependent methyltransferase [Psychrosphaera sp. B3R10]MDO6717932.1 class I SAM-dependent methyltransferase [Psychrosphaera sp. 1_MG-2023]